MVRTGYIPRQVKAVIREHIETAIYKCVDGYASAYEKEDALTGYLFGALRTGEQEVLVEHDELNGTWKWQIDFKMFGGGGKGSSESIIGADGIIELMLFQNNQLTKKSLLFQAKVDWKGSDNRLYDQCERLLTWLGAAIVVNYTETEFTAYGVDSVFENNGRKPAKGQALETLLGGDFLDCHIGDSDLEYDAFKKILIWEDREYHTVFTRFNANRRLSIKIKAPKKPRFEKLTPGMELKGSELASHPLNSGAFDPKIWRINSLEELKRTRNKLAKLFHPDRHPGLPPPKVVYYSEMMKGFNDELAKREQELLLLKRSSGKGSDEGQSLI